MPGFMAGIHVFFPISRQDMDGRNKSGHDALLLCENSY